MKKPARRLDREPLSKINPLVQNLSDAGFDSDLSKLVRKSPENSKRTVDAIKVELGHPDALKIIPHVPLLQQWAQTKALMEVMAPTLKVKIESDAWMNAALNLTSLSEHVRPIVVLRLARNKQNDLTRRFYRLALASAFGLVSIDLEGISIHAKRFIEPGVWVDLIDFGRHTRMPFRDQRADADRADDNLFAAAFILRDYFAKTVSRIEEGWFVLGLEGGWPMPMHEGCAAEFIPGLWMKDGVVKLHFMRRDYLQEGTRLIPTVVRRHKVCSLFTDD